METLNTSPFLSESFLALGATGLDASTAARKAGFRPSDLKAWTSGAKPVPEEALAALRALAPRRVQAPSADFRFIDLFAGIGGMRRAFEQLQSYLKDKDI